MRRGYLIAVAAATLALAVPAPAGAASCTWPKGLYTANAEYEYATYLYYGQTQNSLSAFLYALRNPSDTRTLQTTFSNLVKGGGSRTATYLTATENYAGRAATAIAEDPPRCG